MHAAEEGEQGGAEDDQHARRRLPDDTVAVRQVEVHEDGGEALLHLSRSLSVSRLLALRRPNPNNDKLIVRRPKRNSQCYKTDDIAWQATINSPLGLIS